MKEEMKKIEKRIGLILRIGVLGSCLVMLLGLCLFFVTQNSGYSGDFFPTKIADIFSGVRDFKPFAFLMLGLLMLILTPVLRVFVSIFAFWQERDRLYVKITLLVLAILVLAMFIGHS